MTEKELLLSALSRTLNLDAEQVSALLYQKDGETDVLAADALDKILTADAERISRVKGKQDIEKIKADQYGRGKKDALSALETVLSEKYGIEPTDAGAEAMIEDIVVATRAKAPEGEDAVKRHPVYLSLEKQLQKLTKTQETAIQDAVAAAEKQFSQRLAVQSVQKKAIEALLSLKPVLPKNEAAANNLQRLFAQHFEQYEYEEDEGEFVVLRNGKRVEDNHGHPVKLTDLIASSATQFFDLPVQEPGGGGGNKRTPQSGGKITFQNEQEFQARMFNATSPEERTAIKTAWDSQNAN